MAFPLLGAIGQILMRAAGAASFAGQRAVMWGGQAAARAGAAAGAAGSAARGAASAPFQAAANLPIVGPLLKNGLAGVGNVRNNISTIFNLRMPTVAQQPGLSAAQLMGMAGKSPSEIAAAQLAERTKQHAAAMGQYNTQMQGATRELGASFGQFLLLFVTMGFGWKVFAQRLVTANEALRRYNGGIAAAYERLDIAKRVSTATTADSTAATNVMLADAWAELVKDSQPLHDDLINLTNVVAIGVTRALNSIVLLYDVAMVIAEQIPGIGGVLVDMRQQLAVANQKAGQGMGFAEAALESFVNRAKPKPGQAPQPARNQGANP